MRRRTKIRRLRRYPGKPGIALSVLAILFVCWAIASAFLNAPAVRQRVEAEAQQDFQQPVRIDGTVMLGFEDWLPAVVAHEVVIGKPPAQATLRSLMALIPFDAAAHDFSQPLVVKAEGLSVAGKAYGDYDVRIRPFDDGVALPVIWGRLDAAALDGNLTYRAGKLHLDLHVKNLDYSHLAGGMSGGPVTADIRLDAAGADGASLAGTAEGRVTLLGGAGDLKGNRALDLWAGSLLAAALPSASDGTHLRCAVADFSISRGLARAKTLALETDAAVIDGAGTIDLAGARLDLRFTPHPRSASLSLATPVEVAGPFDAVTVTPDASGVAEKLGGLLFGALAAPLALLPALAAGGGDNPCASYLKTPP